MYNLYETKFCKALLLLPKKIFFKAFHNLNEIALFFPNSHGFYYYHFIYVLLRRVSSCQRICGPCFNEFVAFCGTMYLHPSWFLASLVACCMVLCVTDRLLFFVLYFCPGIISFSNISLVFLVISSKYLKLRVYIILYGCWGLFIYFRIEALVLLAIQRTHNTLRQHHILHSLISSLPRTFSVHDSAL